MSPLERLGLEVVAYQLLGSRTQSATLCALVEAGERGMTFEALSKVKPWRDQEFTNGKNVIKTRICLLRESMDDVGLGGLIKTTPHGYLISAKDSASIVERLSSEANQ